MTANTDILDRFGQQKVLEIVVLSLRVTIEVEVEAMMISSSRMHSIVWAQISEDKVEFVTGCQRGSYVQHSCVLWC
jgi:hypothetical protein